MSLIEKLSIQGIRSFGAKSEDVQCITFSTPVTLILGENGCGKTTIIECLKYALTGDCPPGSDRGKNFVHDPKIFSLVDSLGQIKLQAYNVNGEKISVCRSMRISQRGSKTIFETLDSTVNYLNSKNSSRIDGTISISKRCVDANAAMCEFMGVSKAIINNVLFCHQEDASWPLDEPKKLKVKFDEIFGIVEYNKAIEKLIKMRKERMAELKVLEENLQFLAHLKQEMDVKTLNLAKFQQKCESIQNECTRCEEEEKPIAEKLEAISKIETEMAKYQSLKVQLETKQKNCAEQITNLNKKIKNIFNGDLNALDAELRAFDDKMASKQVQQRELQEELDKFKRKAETYQKNYADLDKKRCLLIQQRQSEQECTSQRAAKMKTLCKELKLRIDEDVESLSQTRVVDILEDIQSTLLSEECQITEVIAQNDDQDHKRQTEIDTLRIELTKLEECITTLQKQLTENKSESKELDRKIIDIEKSTGRLKRLTNEIKQLEECYESALATVDQEGRRKKIEDAKVKINQLQDQFRKLDERLTFLSSIAKLMAEIALKEQELEKKEQEVRRVKSKQNDNLRMVIGKPVEANYRRTVQSACERLRQEIKDLNERAQSARLKEQSYEIKRKNLKEEISRFEKELEEAKEKVFEKCHSVDYEDLLGKCKAAVSKYQVEYSGLRSGEDMYKRYIQKIKDDPCCPLCHKSMSDNEMADVTSELSDEIHQLPANITRAEKLLKAEQIKYESLLQLRPVIEKVSKLEDDIPKRKQQLKDIQAQLAECTNENESLQMASVEPNTNYNVANSMLGDMSLLDEALKEAARLKENVEKLKSKLPQGAETTTSMEDLQSEKSAVSAELEADRSNVEQLQHDYEKLMDKLNELREKKNGLKDEQIKLQEGVQSLPQLKERQNELANLLERIGNELIASKDKMEPLKQRLTKSIAEKSRQKELSRKKIVEMQKKLESYKIIDQEIKRLDNEVKQYQKQNLVNELTKLKQLLLTCKSDIEKSNERISTTVGELDVIKSECVQQETAKRNLKDNRELKLYQQQEEYIKEEFESLTKQVGDLDYRKAVKERTMLMQKRDKITIRKSELLGQMGEINNQIKNIEQEMQEPKYKESLLNYRRANHKVHIKRTLIHDLGLSRVSLEWALIQFHKEKMQQINRLIREYWRLIYRGNDIDYIQIKNDEEKETTSVDRRRSYNYSVVQSKNDSEIEMRGRCSAGQRVLASLIIRMALAETFSSNCGVLALDEPTTNLDRQNIQSLCEALNRIVEERQTQSNFMLIIITHDENFISQLGKSESYHRVFRNSDCKSVIRKVRVTLS